MGCKFGSVVTRVVAGLLCFICVGCSAETDELAVEPTLPVGAHLVNLDWENADFVLPVDGYAMSAGERGVVFAAQNVVYTRCLTGLSEVSTVELARSQVMMNTPHTYGRPRLFFGEWDAGYGAAHGYEIGGTDFSIHMWGTVASVLENDQVRCSSDPVLLTMIPAGVAAIFGDDPAADALTRLYNDSIQQVQHDSRYAPLSAAMGECLLKSGYRLSPQGRGQDYPSMGVEVNPAWSTEQQLAAQVVSATCNDQLGVQQTLVDLMAAYQLQVIEPNKAEYVAIRAEMQTRVDKAYEILREVGLE
ncbi:MAG: hypothetical protein LBJ43_00720 [Propionibacteriaceae bacterium]|nr:hypothetical protein [Propionibacteriaceae bacterium]